MSRVVIINYGDRSTERIQEVLDILVVKNLTLSCYDPYPEDFHPTHVILSGSGYHVYDSAHPPLPTWVLQRNVKVLGICYGMQLIAFTFAGTVRRIDRTGPQDGLLLVNEIIDIKQSSKYRYVNRYDEVVSLANTFHITAVDENDGIMAFTDHKKWWAVQYHPESRRYRDLDVFQRFLTS